MIFPDHTELADKSNERLEQMARDAFLFLLSIALVAHDRGHAIYLYTDREVAEDGEDAKQRFLDMGDEADVKEARDAMDNPALIHLEIRPVPVAANS
jgi:hypothetical protein